VRDGILSSVSVGYRRMDMKLTRASEEDGDEYTVTRWMPFEVSLVTIPADETVGVGRAAETEVPLKSAPKEQRMDKNNAPAGGAAEEKPLGAVEAEKSAARRSSTCASRTASTRASKRAGSRTARSSRRWRRRSST
jgi:hypothetical protein